MIQRKVIMKKRILSIVLVLCTVLAMMPTTVFAAETKYRVFVGDTYFTSKVTTIMVGSGTAGYAPDSKVLLLHGITLNYGNSQMAAIESEIENLEIKVFGTNTINLTGDSMIGIHLMQNTKITGMTGSKLIINCSGNVCEGIYADSDYSLTLENMDITINYKPTSGSVIGVRSKTLDMKDTCNVKLVSSMSVTGGDSFGYIHSSSDSTVNIGDNANVTFDGWETAIDSLGTLNLTGGALNVTNSYDGIYTDGTLNLTGGTLKTSGSRLGILAGANSKTNFAGTDATVKGGTTGWGYEGSSASYSITGGRVVFEGGSYAASKKYSSVPGNYRVYAGSGKDRMSRISSPTDNTFLNNKYVQIAPPTYYTLTLVNVKGATSASHEAGDSISYTAAYAPSGKHFSYWSMQVDGGTASNVGTISDYTGKMPAGNATLTAVFENCSGGTATCQAKARCSSCAREYGSLAAHNFSAEVVDDKYVITAATCEGAGTYYKSCTYCGLSSKNQNNATFTVPALGHEISDWQTDSQEHWKKCNRCWEGFDLGEHVYGEPVLIENCVGANYLKSTCTVCGKVKTEEREPSGHIWDEGYVLYEPKCYTTGTLIHTCARCGTSEGVAIPMVPHEPEYREYKAATCTEDGNIEYWECGLCIRPFLDEACTQRVSWDAVTLEKTGHTLKHSEDVVATCTEDGSKEHWECTACGKLFLDEACTQETTLAEVIFPATGHTVVRTEVPATCTQEGMYSEKCSVCNADLRSGVIATIPHNYENDVCTVCGKEKPDVTLGDINGDGKVNAIDSNLMKKIILGGYSPTKAADINEDGKYNSADSNLIKKIIMGTYNPN